MVAGYKEGREEDAKLNWVSVALWFLDAAVGG